MQPTHAQMSSFKSCLVCEVPLAGDSIADWCVDCTPLRGNLSAQSGLPYSEVPDAASSDESEFKDNDGVNSTGCLTDVAAAGRFETAKAVETQEMVVHARGFPAIPNHKVLREIGHGSGGKVYEATHLATARKVAVKIVPGGDPIDRERFFREVRALRQISSPDGRGNLRGRRV